MTPQPGAPHQDLENLAVSVALKRSTRRARVLDGALAAGALVSAIELLDPADPAVAALAVVAAVALLVRRRQSVVVFAMTLPSFWAAGFFPPLMIALFTLAESRRPSWHIAVFSGVAGVGLLVSESATETLSTE
jgi:MYXO-CTERM domain-containing protein